MSVSRFVFVEAENERASRLGELLTLLGALEVNFFCFSKLENIFFSFQLYQEEQKRDQQLVPVLFEEMNMSFGDLSLVTSD